MAELFRERYWTKYLPDGFIMQVYLKTDQGMMTLFVALVKDGECVTRYDNAHGFAPQRRLGQDNCFPLEKERFNTLTLSEVFNYAIKDISENYAEYDEEYGNTKTAPAVGRMNT